MVAVCVFVCVHACVCLGVVAQSEIAQGHAQAARSAAKALCCGGEPIAHLSIYGHCLEDY